MTVLGGFFLLHLVLLSLYDVLSSLYVVLSSLCDGLPSLYDRLPSLYDRLPSLHAKTFQNLYLERLYVLPNLPYGLYINVCNMKCGYVLQVANL